jgi:hypothetical protein
MGNLPMRWAAKQDSSRITLAAFVWNIIFGTYEGK